MRQVNCILKKIIISMLAAAFITVIIPLVIVEIFKPENNAESTMPAETAGETEKNETESTQM